MFTNITKIITRETISKAIKLWKNDLFFIKGEMKSKKVTCGDDGQALAYLTMIDELFEGF